MTCVSGYWKVHNKHDDKFTEWFKTTLRINCPYVFFGDKETIEIIKGYRKTLPTYYVELNIKDFYTYKYKSMMKIDAVHCPSVELNLIWNEKIFLIQKALELNPFDSNYFMWNDAGVCTLRERCPPETSFPDINKLNKLPKDKFIYSSSNIFNKFFFKKSLYHIAHHIAGTNYILHENIVKKITNLYIKYLDLIEPTNIWTDQVIWTHIYKDNKDMFYKLCDGYGEIINILQK